MTHEQLLQLIHSDDVDFPPVTEELALRAYIALLSRIDNRVDALYVFACLNLLNAYVKQAPKESEFSKRYQFKRHVVTCLEEVIRKRLSDVALYYSPDVTYVKILALQFSFHHVAPSRLLTSYAASPHNTLQEWSGIRLQPSAVVIMEWAGQLRASRSFPK